MWNIFENSTKLVVRSIAIEEEANNVILWSIKDSIKVKNALLQGILENMLENQTFQRMAKFIMVDSYEMDSHEK